MIRLYHGVFFKNSVSAQSLTGRTSVLGPLTAPARGADTRPGLINPFEHHLRCRGCCVWFPSAQGCRGLLIPAGLSSSLGITRSRCLCRGMQGRRAGRCPSRRAGAAACAAACLCAKGVSLPCIQAVQRGLNLKISSGRMGPGGEAGGQWGAVSAPLAWPRRDGLSA